MTSLQLTLNYKKNIWSTPVEYKDLSDAKEIAIDLETKDDGINEGLGAGWALGKGNIVGFAEGNVIKYICRHAKKDKKKDILKAIHYCEMIIERDYE